jgi:hypothetical protein
VGYEQRTTADDFVVSAVDTGAGTGRITLSNNGGQSYKELQVSGRYQFHKHLVNASYVRSRAYGDLNDFFQFSGRCKTGHPTQRAGRLSSDAPNRFLLSGEFKHHGSWCLLPCSICTGFPIRYKNEFRE